MKRRGILQETTDDLFTLETWTADADNLPPAGATISYRRSALSDTYTGVVLESPSTHEGDGPACLLVRCSNGKTHHVPVGCVVPEVE